jgi:predicted HAD superfamily Cof-like phosphohydrolase
MSDLTITELWFKRAKPEPTPQNFNTQLGVHLEEIVEMLDTMRFYAPHFQGGTIAGKDMSLRNKLHVLAEDLKSGHVRAEVENRVEFLDALADQIVTATGSGYMAGMNVPVAMDRVNASNFSKFDDNGMPLFDANGKIKKGPNYRKVNLEDLV